MFEVPRLQKPLGCECRRGTAVRVVHSSSDAKPGAPSSAMYPGRYQLLARYFWPISSLGPRPNQPQHGSLLVSRAGKEGSGRYSAHS